MSSHKTPRPDPLHKPSYFERQAIRPLQYLTDLLFKEADPVSQGLAVELGSVITDPNRTVVQDVNIPLVDLLRHVIVLGQTGGGKTRALANLILQFYDLGLGVGIPDVKGDFTDLLLNLFISRCKTKQDLVRLAHRLVLLELHDDEFSFTLDLLGAQSPARRIPMALELAGVIKNMHPGASWGARMEEVLRNSILALAEAVRPFSDGPRFLVDPSFREPVLAHVRDPELLFYWRERFGRLSGAMQSTYAEPVLNKLGIFFSSPHIRDIFSTPTAGINLRDLMDRGHIIILNASKGRLASPMAKFVIGCAVSLFKSAAFSRVDIPEEARRPFFLVVDETQNFLGPDASAFREVLSESRQYQLSLMLAHQNLSQLDHLTRDSILGNVNVLLCFHLGPDDSRDVARFFKRSERARFEEEVMTLGVGQAIKREPDGTYRKVAIRRVEPGQPNPAALEFVRRVSRERYYRPRSEIEAERRRSAGAVIVQTEQFQENRATPRPPDEAPPNPGDTLPEGEL